jgi:exonuclease III
MSYHCLMRIITVNTTRAAAAEGSFRPLARQCADFVCLQQAKAHVHPIGGGDVELPRPVTMGYAF